ncbi:hypothetical protein IFM89_024717 [Coptis chinensis]|uniref:Cellulose synthase n=1 Tax=Coptis chinensis TaxID=261450 RepID=A0A835HB46_9MAGN|nr:hypothetical protein IFM89_024717 [Coptis chinensis]
MMKTSRESKNTISPLHTYQPLSLTTLNRAFAVVYTCAALALFYHHILTLIHSTTLLSIFLRLSLLVSDAIFTFMWATTQAFRMRPIKRKEYLENLPCIIDYKDYPSLDVFICTADPYKEPPINVINTALSVMAYDYPSDKVSVYVSDDGGSMLTLFAFMEAAKFATHWLPFCRENNIVDRCPAAYFQSTHAHIRSSKTEEIRVVGSRVRLEQYRWEQKITQNE